MKFRKETYHQLLNCQRLAEMDQRKMSNILSCPKFNSFLAMSDNLPRVRKDTYNDGIPQSTPNIHNG